MSRHGPGLGAGNFPSASKLLKRYEHDRAYKLHQQKVQNVKHRLDVKEPKKQNHLILRLKQIQKEEERQAEIDHENKILLNKMTHVLKYGGNIDNWNNYESRSLNYPFREKQNEDIARENIGIARRLETVKPKLAINKWEKDYQQHQYLKRMWSDSVKDYGDFTPRRYRSRMSRTVQRSLDNSLNDTYDEDFHSVDTTEEKKLPSLRKKKELRTAKSETNVPASRRDGNKGKPATKLPKITPNKAENGVSGGAGNDDKSDVAQLFKIAKQLGKPEDIFIKTLIKKTHKQRMVTKAKFRQKYDLDLVTELKNGLGQPWEYLIDAMLQERGVADSYAVFDALSTADMGDVVELLCSRDNASIAELKESYRKEFSISLEEDISDRSKPPLQTVLLTLQKGMRDEAPDVDHEAVRKDAQELFEYGDGRWESDNGIFIKLLNERSFAHLQAVFTEFKAVSGGQDILQAMKRDTSKDYFKILHTLVQCIGTPESYYAELLHRHKLPSDPVLVGTLAIRSEIDMPEVRKTYKKMFSMDITEEIKSKSHPTQKCLIELASKVPTGTKKKVDAKKTYMKDGAADQQSHPQPSQTAAKKPPPGKKPEHKVKGQGQSESGDTVTSSKMDNEAKGSQKSEPKQQSKSKNSQDGKKAPEAASSGNHRGTVRSASNFRPEDDCNRLNSAMSGERADESIVVSIIPKRSNRQRQQLKATYEQKFQKNLTIDLTSEMTGDWEEIVLALMKTPAEYDAHVVHEAVDGLGTSEPTLIAILCTRSAQELKAIKDNYRKAGGGDFDMDVTRDCGGDLKNLLIHLARGERAVGTAVNIQQAQSDAKDLHQNGILSDTFVNILSKQNHFQVKATLEEFKKLSGEDIYAAINKASLGDDEDVYVNIVKAVEDPVQFHAEKLQGCFSSMGTNDNLLIRMVVPRSEVDLEDIKQRYYELYTRSLYDAVNGQCQGDYKAMLLAVINNGDSDVKKGQQKKPIAANAKPKQQPKKDSNPTPASGGTVKPAKPFNPIEDSEKLNEAMSGFGTDEVVIIDILPYRTNDQRQEIKAKYQDKFNKNLQEQLESELRGDFEEIVLALMMKPLDYACHSLHESVKGLGTREGVLIGVLTTKTNKELAVIKNRYQEIYGKDLELAITQDVSRGMEDMFVELLKCERDQAETANIQEAKEDAKRLYKEGQISIDPTDEVFKNVLARKSRIQVKATFQEYKKLTGNDIYTGIKKALVGDDEDAYVGLARAVEDPIWFYAEAIHSCFDGMGTNDTRLIRIIVARSEIDLADIKMKYKSLFNKTISESIEDECNGDYKKILLAILGDLHQSDKDDARSDQTSPPKTDRETRLPIVLPNANVSTDDDDDDDDFEDNNNADDTENEDTNRVNMNKGSETDEPINDGDKVYTDSENTNTTNNAKATGKNTKSNVKGKSSTNKGKNQKVKKRKNTNNSKEDKAGTKNAKVHGKHNATKDTKPNKPETKESCTQYDLDEEVPEQPVLAEVDDACKQLREAIQEKKTNKALINNILSELDDSERRKLCEKYRERYDKDLLEELRPALKSQHLLLVQGLLQDQSKTDAECLYHAVRGFGTDESLILYLLIARNQEDLSAMKKNYLKLYKKDLHDVIESEMSGSLRKLCHRLSTKVNPVGKTDDADREFANNSFQKLAKPRQTLDRGRNTESLIDTMAMCNSSQYQMLSDLCKENFEMSLAEYIATTTKGDIQEGLLSIASLCVSPADYHAQNIARAFKGFRNNDRLLIAVLLPNLQDNIPEVQDAYQSRYYADLVDVFRRNCGKHDHGKLWIKLIEKHSTKS